MLSTRITGTGTKGKISEADVITDNSVSGLVAYTEPFVDRRAFNGFAINDTYGINMAISAIFGGSPVLVNDGEDTIAWEGSSIEGGKFTFDSTDEAHTGTKSVKTDNAAVGDVMQFLDSGTVDLSNYVAVTMFIYVDKDWKEDDSIGIYGWNGSIQGNQILLEDYFDEGNFNVWQKLTIPLSDMGLSSSIIDAFRIEILDKEGKSPKYYIDDFQIEELGEVPVFKLEPPKGTIVEIFEVNVNLAAALDTTLLNANMPNLSYNGYLTAGLLNNGLLFTTTIDGVTTFAGLFRSIGESMRSGAVLENAICDGTNTHITLKSSFSSPVILDSRTLDNISILLVDDLSALLEFNVNARGAVIDLPILK